ncbi:MAG: hypothetical protein HKO59_17395 [Phycisphaerales bacterium]|nr:hypothetical protein [Phycisphaerae bacterium]NNM27723.1 hypothetical protein [Phycisphaerales bacterium]
MRRTSLIRLGLTLPLAGGGLVVCSAPPPPPSEAGPAGDQYIITLDAETRSTPATGRVMLFFITERTGRWPWREPSEGPFWEPPQPIASVAVDNWQPGETITIDREAVSFPSSLDELRGPVRVQAVLDVDDTERSHRVGPGNLASAAVTADLDERRPDVVRLTLDRRVRPMRLPPETDHLKWIELRSPMLSAHYGRDVYHRAGVALPPEYVTDPSPERRWPTVYKIPGYGGRHDLAATYAQMLTTHGIEEIAPMAVYVVLDPEAPLGHHGFVDSACNGPRGTALVEELIPHLEERFRLVARTDGRMLMGHSSGGWTSLWLQLRWPEVFDGCWASAPDPVDFSAFQMSDLYADENLYTDERGVERPSYRRIVSLDGDTEPVMTVRQECRMEHAMDPRGGSGQQWDAWEAMFSPRDPVTGFPRPLFDATTGAIDRAVVERWRQYDMTRLVDEQWSRYAAIVTERIRLSCGELDSFYLQRAVARFKEVVERHAAASGGWLGPGYVNLVPDATHATLTTDIFQRVNREMRAALRERGLHP